MGNLLLLSCARLRYAAHLKLQNDKTPELKNEYMPASKTVQKNFIFASDQIARPMGRIGGVAAGVHNSRANGFSRQRD
jgi:hypothetical protein